MASNLDDEIPMLVPALTKQIPVTIITGYLGAGKSTLLQHILLEQSEKKFAVLMNEIGQGFNWEEKIILAQTEKTVEEWIELPNGCLCCSAKDNGVKALESLLKKKTVIDYIIVETTGLADPGPVASVFWLDKELGSNIFLDGIVTVVDGKFGLQELHKSRSGEPGSHGQRMKSEINEWLRQVALADVVIINKMELTTQEEAEQLKAGIRDINGIAEIIEATRGRVDVARFLDLGMYSTDCEKLIFKIAKQCEEASSEPRHLEQKSVSTFCLRVSQIYRRETYEQFFQTLLWEKKCKAEVIRIKGVVTVHGSSVPLVVNGVYDTYAMEPMNMEATDGESNLVFIGVDVDEDIRLIFDQTVLKDIWDSEPK